MSDLKQTNENGGCGCGHDHDHEHEMHTVTIELENGDELECPIIEIFEVDGKEYIALLHPEEEIALLYGFKDHEDGSLELTEIVSDDEYETVSEAFNELLAEEDEE